MNESATIAAESISFASPQSQFTSFESREPRMDMQSFERNQTASILIVDDDPDNLMLLSYQVSQCIGCSVICAPEAVTALELAKQAQPDLILLDMMLPDMDGFEVARRLKQTSQTQHIPIIGVSAMARSIDREQALQAGCREYLCKPYDIDQLAALVQQCLEQAAIERAPKADEALNC